MVRLYVIPGRRAAPYRESRSSGAVSGFRVRGFAVPRNDGHLLFRLVFFGDALDRNDLLVFGGIEHDHALRRATGDTDPAHLGANELAGVGDKHDLVGFLDREGRDEPADLLLDLFRALLSFPDIHRDDAFAAAAGDPVLVGRGALAVAALRNGQNKLLGRRHLDITLLAKLDRAVRLLGILAGL